MSKQNKTKKGLFFCSLETFTVSESLIYSSIMPFGKWVFSLASNGRKQPDFSLSIWSRQHGSLYWYSYIWYHPNHQQVIICMNNPCWLKSDSCHCDPGLKPPETSRRSPVLSLSYQSTIFCSLEWVVIKVKNLEDLPGMVGIIYSPQKPKMFFLFQKWVNLFSRLKASLIYTASHNYTGKSHFKNKKKRSLISIFPWLRLE